ncbi:MAG: MBL fold metallo-hydrolase [Spirochaetes bacterium]|nr:MBL fold metallo-hydrolase [Spirochaetota bacterium]
MEILCRTVGLLAANCYILRNGDEAIIIDPGGDPQLLYPCIGDRVLLYVINTHGHYDHIAANNPLKARYDTRLACFETEAQMLFNPDKNLSAMVGARYISVAPDLLLSDGDTLNIGRETLEIIHTPGHTEGSISLRMGTVLFSGDTLFYHSVGRTDLPGGDLDTLRESIKTRLYSLPDETIVYTGHGESTMIGEEKRYNEWVRV